jgi:PASTA domain
MTKFKVGRAVTSVMLAGGSALGIGVLISTTPAIAASPHVQTSPVVVPNLIGMSPSSAQAAISNLFQSNFGANVTPMVTVRESDNATIPASRNGVVQGQVPIVGSTVTSSTQFILLVEEDGFTGAPPSNGT